MDEREFIDAVRRTGGIESAEAARSATLATLETLGEHVSEGQEEDLAASLPDELAEALVGTRGRAPESFSRAEFRARVCERAGIDEPTALRRSRAVLAVLADTVGEGELRDTRDQLPDEFDVLFETGELLDATAFLERVHREAGLDSRDAARDATLAALRTLGERISEGEASILATYLPDEFADAVTELASREASDFGFDEFVRRVADREGVDKAQAREHLAAVMTALTAAAGEYELGKVRSQLPAEFDALWEA